VKGGRRGYGGYREDIGMYVRSKMEHNYVLFLNFLIKHGNVLYWEYEPYEFEFHRIKRGTRFYKPDFKVTYDDGHYEWHEVKGYMDAKSKTQLTRMKRFYPDEVIRVIDNKVYRDIKKNFAAALPGWER